MFHSKSVVYFAIYFVFNPRAYKDTHFRSKTAFIFNANYNLIFSLFPKKYYLFKKKIF
jgi:hypothetical protein